MKNKLIGLLFAVACLASAQDTYQQIYTPFTQFRNVKWGSGAGAVNNGFWFNSLAPENGICVVVENQNPTNSHSFTLAVWQSSDPATFTFTGNGLQWANLAAGVTFPQTVLARNNLAFFYPTRSAAFIGLIFSGSVVAAGNPDTANVIVVQSSNSTSCSNIAVTNSIQGMAAAGTTTAAFNPVLIAGWGIAPGGQNNTWKVPGIDNNSFSMVVGAGANGINNDSITNYHVESMNYGPAGNAGIGSVIVHGDQNDSNNLSRIKNSKKFGQMVGSNFTYASNELLAKAWGVWNGDVVNPTAGFNLLAINENGSNSSGLLLYRIIVGCSVACDLQLWRTSALGSACTALTNYKVFEESVVSTSTITSVKGNCTTNPTTIQQIMHIFLPAGDTRIIDMTGYWMHVTSTGAKGYMLLQGAAVTGTVSATMEWAERN